MPVLTRPISELTDHVFMPIVRQISHRLIKMLGYSDVIGDQIYINADWSTHSDTSKNDNANVGQTRFTVDANLQLNPTSQKWDCYTFHHTTAYGVNNINLHDKDPIYADPINGVRISEMVSPVTIQMSCNLVLQSSELAFQTPQMIFNAFENGSVFTFVDLVYDYPLPKPIISTLLQIWRMDRKYGEPSGVSFEKYIKDRSNGGWQIRKHRELDEYEIVVPRYDLKSLSTLEYSDDKPEGVMEDKLPVGWSIPFSFTIQFALPTLNIMKFPAVINNQLLPDGCIPKHNNQRYNGMPEFHHGIADEAYDKAYLRFHDLGYWQLPWYDDWQVPAGSPLRQLNHKEVLILGVLVEEDSEDNIIDLSEDFDPNIKLSNLVKEFLYQEGEQATDFHSPYTISVFKDDHQLHPESIHFDEDLILSFKADNLYQRYRIVISVNTDTYNIRPKWYPLLAQYYKSLPTDTKCSMYHRLIDGDWSKGIPKNFFKFDFETGIMTNALHDQIFNLSTFNYDKYSTNHRSIELEDRLTSMGTQEGGVVVNAFNSNVGVFGSTIVTGKAGKS